MLAAEYSTRAGGQTWSANIEPFAGEYVATVPNLPGATAAGLTVAQVEDTLSYLISFFA
jgi:predicted RNase H-like HicB family nuclease